MPREERSRSRRLETPDKEGTRARSGTDGGKSRRSRSRALRDSLSGHRRSRLNESSSPCRDKLRALEREIEEERERLRKEEKKRECRRVQRSVSNRVDLEPTSQRYFSRSPTAGSARLSRRRKRSPSKDGDYIRSKRNRAEKPDQHPERSGSTSGLFKDVVDILNTIKNSPQPPTSVAPTFTPYNSHKNILPDFNPSSKSQRIDIWIKKVNECSSVYGWDEKTTIHYAMQKLQGLAKTWYESLPSILFNWTEWQDKILKAFPCEQNYGQILEDMLRRKSRFNEAIEVYFYEKLALLNQCNIEGKHAVDCIIHGLTDKTIKSSAISLRCTHPEQLLQFLISNKESSQSFNKPYNNNFRPDTNNTKKAGNRPNPIVCFNCKETGHFSGKCPKPLIKCTKCNRIGHKTENCFANTRNYGNHENKQPIQKTMTITNFNPSSKFFKEVFVNKIATRAFVDFGSEVSLMKCSHANRLGLLVINEPSTIKGFGNEMVRTLGKVSVSLSVDGVDANVFCHVVDDKYLELPILIGQSFTEQCHVAVYKTSEKLNFFNIGTELPFSGIDIHDSPTIKVTAIADLDIHGLSSVKAVLNPKVYGELLVDTKIIGKLPHQFVILGGIYPIKNNIVYVLISPLSTDCEIKAGMTISRGLDVKVVNRVVSSTNEGHGFKINRDKIRMGDTVEEFQRKKLFTLLDNYKHCFASTLKELGCTNIAEMTIEVNNNKPIVYRPYRLSYKEREDVREMVNDMLDAGIVRESVSEYASPIILVRKKDGKIRMCVDYRMLNSVTVKERYPMPNIDDEISRLSGQAYFVTLDLTSGYYQVPIAENARPLTSFVTPDGQYEFNRMPFGLANAPAVFQRMMHKVLGHVRYDGVTSYIDDVLIYGRNVEECLARLESVLKLLETANLTLNLEKCEFLKNKIDYLGYEISIDGVRPGNKKIQCVIDFPCPSDQHTVRQFLGLVGYFRKFIQNFATLAHPLTKLLTKDAAWAWTHEQENAFKVLKDKLTNRPILAIYNPTAETELHTDASKLGVGGVLLQKSDDGNSFKPVAFYSRKTSPEEKNFHAYELETLAVICSLKKFRVYLLGCQFKVVTDCSALRSTFSKRDILPRVARWWLLMQEFQCTVEYRPSAKMTHVDSLSRNPILDNETLLVLDQYPAVMSISNEDWLLTLQLGDTELCRIRDILHTGIDSDGLKYIKDNYLVKDNKLYRYLNGDQNNIRWVVPKGARWQICRINHDEIGHFGVEKTLDRIKQSYWFSKMSRFIKKYVNACIECAYAKKNSSTKEGYLYPIQKVGIPFHTLHIDHLGPFVKSKRGNTYLLVIVDAFTKFVITKSVRNTKTQSAIKALEDVFYTFRAPDRIISDRGTCFTSHAFKRFCLDKGVKHVLNAVASPRSNGQVERYNRTILNSLTAQNLNHNEKDWDVAVGKVQWGLNNTCQKATGRTPAEIMFGTGMNSEMNPKLNEVRQETREIVDLTTIRKQAKESIDAQQEKQKLRYDKGRRAARIYAEGELVKITKTIFTNDGKSKKLLPAYVGPYRVVSVLRNDRYRVAAIPGLTGTKNKRQTTVAADRMLPWVNIASLEINESDTSENNEESDDESCSN